LLNSVTGKITLLTVKTVILPLLLETQIPINHSDERKRAPPPPKKVPPLYMHFLGGYQKEKTGFGNGAAPHCHFRRERAGIHRRSSTFIFAS
jgi:hypothetical protein